MALILVLLNWGVTQGFVLRNENEIYQKIKCLNSDVEIKSVLELKLLKSSVGNIILMTSLWN